MFARVLTGVWRENVEATQSAWQRLFSARSNESSIPGDSSHQHSPEPAKPHTRTHRKVIGGATAAIAVLALTYSAASALVSGATGSSAARSDYVTVMQAAAAEYRRARTDCLALPFERRDPCVADAHSNESKLRSAATSAPRKQLSEMRQKSDQVLLAAQRLDSAVLEPACNVVARGSASVCDIQVKGSRVEGPEALASTRNVPAAMLPPAPVAAVSIVPIAAVSIVPAVARGERNARQPSAQWVPVSGRERSHYFANVAGLVSP